MSATRHWPWLTAVLISLLVPLCQFPEVFFGHAVFATQDIVQLEVPKKAFFARSLLHGEGSLLYPYSQLGLSAVMNPAHALIYPPNLLYALARPWAATRAFILLHYELLGLGWFLALGRLGAAPLARLGTVAIFLASGVIWSTHSIAMIELASTAWTGWAVYCFARGVARNGRFWSVLAGVAVGLIYLGGDPLLACLCPLLAWACSRCTGRGAAPGAPARRQLAALGIMGWSAALTLGPLFIQNLLGLPFTERAYGFVPFEQLSYSSHWVRILDVLVPGALPPLGSPAFPWPSIRYGMEARWWYASLALGFVATGYVALGAWRWRRCGGARVLLLMTLTAATLALGVHSSVVRAVWHSALPNIRFPERLLRTAMLAAVPFLGLGLDAALAWAARRPPGRLRRWLPVVLTCLPLAEIARGLPPANLAPEAAVDHAPAPFADLAARPEGERIAGERVIYCPELRSAPPPAIPAVDTRAWEVPIVSAPDSSGARIDKALGCRWLAGKMTMAWLGISHVFTPLLAPTERADLERRLGLTWLKDFPSFDLSASASQATGPAIGWFVSDVVTARVFPDMSDAGLGEPSLDFAAPIADIARGRFHVDADWTLGADGLPRRSGAEVRELLRDVAPCSEPRPVPLGVTGLGGRISFTVDAPCPGVVALPWNFIPGWRTTRNDGPQSLIYINELTLGVPVPQGRSRIELRFSPPLFGVSLAVASLLLAMTVVLALRARRR